MEQAKLEEIRLHYDEHLGCWVGVVGSGNAKVAWTGPTDLAAAVATATHAERERCAAIADALKLGFPGHAGPGPSPVLYQRDVAEAIRRSRA